ncbi:MAG: putative adhesin [Bacteroidota bacterium]|jgi:hypothetical protein
MKKTIALTLLLFSFSQSIIGQGFNSTWLVGYESSFGVPFGVTKLEFTNSTLTVSYNPIDMYFGVTMGVANNRNGDLQFYTNGIYIANRNNDTMSNGNGLNPSSYTTSNNMYGLDIPQQNMILQFPNDSTKYYLFHCTIDDDAVDILTKKIYSDVIDMALDSGRGFLDTKNQILINDRFVFGRLTACKHANGRDWWLFAYGFQNRQVYRWLITPYGISPPNIQLWMINRDNWAGAFIFSPDGTKAVYHGNAQGTEIYDFDRCSGTFSNGVYIPMYDSSGAGGAAISPNSRYLYINCIDSLWQYDLTASNIAASEIFIDKYNGDVDSLFGLPTPFVLQALAADGKIYMATGNGTRYYHVINYPDSAGLACDFVQKGLQIPTIKYITVPNFPNYYLGADTNSICDSLSHIGLEEKEKIVMTVFPNPVSSGGTVSLQYKTITQEGKIDLYDVNGRLVKQYYVSPYTSMYHLKLPALKTGMYLLRMESGGRAGSHKVVVE